MSRYGYANRGYSSYNGVPPRANEWSEASYASDDHVCRPVIVDDEGRKMPIVMSIPGVYDYEQRYVAKVERVVEHVRVPVFAQFRKSSSPPKIEPAEDYGYRYSSLPPKVEPEKMYGRYSSPPKKETGKDYNYGGDKWRRPSSPPEDRPQEVEEFITKVQTEASRPNRFPINPANRRQIPVANRNNGDYDDYYRRNDAAMEPSQPTMVTTGGRSQPARDGKLGKPTSDIATAMENLKEAATALSVTTGVPYKRNSIPEIIDSREAARRYSNLNVPSRPETTGETYTTTITSKEAAKKYGGVPV